MTKRNLENAKQTPGIISSNHSRCIYGPEPYAKISASPYPRPRHKTRESKSQRLVLPNDMMATGILFANASGQVAKPRNRSTRLYSFALDANPYNQSSYLCAIHSCRNANGDKPRRNARVQPSTPEDPVVNRSPPCRKSLTRTPHNIIKSLVENKTETINSN